MINIMNNLFIVSVFFQELQSFKKGDYLSLKID